MDEHSDAFKVGDRVRTASGITGTVVVPPRRYETAKGDTFTGWGVVVEEDTPADLTLTRIEQGLSQGARHLARLDRLTRIPSMRLHDALVGTINEHLARYPDTTDKQILEALFVISKAVEEHMEG